MIQLTKLNGQTFLLNALLIEKIESLPDTTITLIDGKKYIVKDQENIVKQKIIHFYKEIGIIGMLNELEVKEDE